VVVVAMTGSDRRVDWWRDQPRRDRRPGRRPGSDTWATAFRVRLGRQLRRSA